MNTNNSLLGFALLGLLHQHPMSGYDLRKIFASSAMGSFSDSPGAIYPALARLEVQGLIRGKVENSASLRKRRLFKLAPKGVTAFRAWVKRPVRRDDVIRRLGELMLRFAFTDQSLGDRQAALFLKQFEAELAGYIPSLKQYLDTNVSKMPLSGRLALECGIQEYEARLKWARTSLAFYERRRRNKL